MSVRTYGRWEADRTGPQAHRPLPYRACRGGSGRRLPGSPSWPASYRRAPLMADARGDAVALRRGPPARAHPPCLVRTALAFAVNAILMAPASAGTSTRIGVGLALAARPRARRPRPRGGTAEAPTPLGRPRSHRRPGVAAARPSRHRDSHDGPAVCRHRPGALHDSNVVKLPVPGLTRGQESLCPRGGGGKWAGAGGIDRMTGGGASEKPMRFRPARAPTRSSQHHSI